MIRASAAGKLLLYGEYAVLYGGIALVSAVDRRVTATMLPVPGNEWRLHTRPLAATAMRFRFCPRRGIAPLGGARLPAVVRAVLRETLLGSPGLQNGGWELVLDSRALYAAGAPEPTKLGFGSSAAVAAALAAALAAAGGTPRPELTRLIALHRAAQGGRGSGVDVAASWLGGQHLYRLEASGPRTAPISLPADACLAVVFAGRAASTTAALDRLERWAEGHPGEFDDCMRQLRERAAAATRCLRRGGDLATALGPCAEGLLRLQQASGLPIYAGGHEHAARLAAAEGCVYKPSGAGGGDLGLLAADEPARLARALGRLERAGLRAVDVRLEGAGAEAVAA